MGKDEKFFYDLSYKILDRKIDRFLRLNCLVENEIVLELKSLEAIMPVHEAQLLTYLKLTGKQVGLLINFNVPLLKDGILRRILGSVNTSLDIRKNLENTEKTESLSTQRGAN